MNGIIVKYLQGEATDEEKRLFLDWLRESSENRKLFSQMRDIWLVSGKSPLADSDYAKRAFRRFEAEVRAMDTRRKRIRLHACIRKAAAVIFCILCLTGGYFTGSRNYLGQHGQAEASVMNRVIIGKDSKGVVTLPDGTRVWLNADSKLIYPEVFDSDCRRVSLEGEGYFEVIKNEKMPFYVETNGMSVHVLGTRFDVKNYESKATSETTLLTGRVEVFFPGTQKKAILEPNQKITCDKQTGTYRLTKVNAADYILWINERLVCTNETLAVVLYRMKRWYGIEIVCDQGVPLEQRLSLVIRKESPDEIFELLEMIVPVKYRIDGDRVVVSPAGR